MQLNLPKPLQAMATYVLRRIIRQQLLWLNVCLYLMQTALQVI